MNELQEIQDNRSTEDKIKEAARRVFLKKGYAATRTRDIAEESGFNIALINYYFRSKEKLFDIIMVEHLQMFFHSIVDLMDDKDTTLRQKIELIIGHYIDILIKNPDLPLFIFNEVNSNPGKLAEKIGVSAISNRQLHIITQWTEMMETSGLPAFNPIHMLMNIVGLTIFPFIGSPMIRNRTGISIEQFNALMEERKKLIPVWINAILYSQQQLPNEKQA